MTSLASKRNPNLSQNEFEGGVYQAYFKEALSVTK